MADSNGFIDLRIGHGAQGVGDDSVWPSFTDVMTVIVMIFLMALVVIMVRNFELDRQLIATMSDREATEALNQDLSQAKSLLESSLTNTQSERDALRAILSEELKNIALLIDDQDKLELQLAKLTELRLQLASANTELTDEKQQATAEIAQLLQNEQDLNSRITALSNQLSQLEIQTSEDISALTEDKQTLGEKLDTVSTQLLEVKVLLDQAKTENKDLSLKVSSLKEEKEGTEELYAIAADEIKKLVELIRIRESENTALQAEADSSTVQFRSLQDEYNSLDVKYRDLIRPARSSAGKVVVNLWIAKVGEGYVYRVRQPDQSESSIVSRGELESVLLSLKEQHGKSLYTRIIIPEESGLSHNEAWKFTQDILQKYDYYNQP